MEQKHRIPAFVHGALGVVIWLVIYGLQHLKPSLLFGSMWYFFIAATVGFLIMRVVMQEWTSLKHPPVWAILTVTTYLISVLLILAAGNHQNQSALLFPFLQGSLFVIAAFAIVSGYAGNANTENILLYSLLAAVNVLFAFWAYWEFIAPFDKSEKKVVLRRVLLIILFVFILFGTVTCSFMSGADLSGLN